MEFLHLIDYRRRIHPPAHPDSACFVCADILRNRAGAISLSAFAQEDICIVGTDTGEVRRPVFIAGLRVLNRADLHYALTDVVFDPLAASARVGKEDC